MRLKFQNRIKETDSINLSNSFPGLLFRQLIGSHETFVAKNAELGHQTK